MLFCIPDELHSQTLQALWRVSCTLLHPVRRWEEGGGAGKCHEVVLHPLHKGMKFASPLHLFLETAAHPARVHNPWQ